MRFGVFLEVAGARLCVDQVLQKNNDEGWCWCAHGLVTMLYGCVVGGIWRWWVSGVRVGG